MIKRVNGRYGISVTINFDQRNKRAARRTDSRSQSVMFYPQRFLRIKSIQFRQITRRAHYRLEHVVYMIKRQFFSR